ncbi:MAG: acyltransferase, partial [Bifidobacteriaceae bacterium]|nr:acyltransferase [Bifidobacteriaceae bacterium]
MSAGLATRRGGSRHAAPGARASFRADIQGIRALAVAMVLVFHLWPDALPGGFTGVDVFFVVSGFLMTRHILRREPTMSVRRLLVDFYARRLRRLAPAASVVLAAVVAGSWAWLPFTEWKGVARNALASSVFIENWLMAKTSTDYFAADGPANALQHYWSLSVEEQFYIVWPLFIVLALLIARRVRPLRGNPVALVAALTLASFAYGLWAADALPGTAYYVTPARVWQLTAGATVALLPLPGRKARALLPWIGLASIAAGAWMIHGENAYPGLAALWPTAGAVLMLLGGGRAGRFSFDALAAFRPIQWLGDISYSLYLWHWPLIVLLPAALGIELDSAARWPVAVLALAAGHLSYNLIENPVRRSHSLNTSFDKTYFAAFCALTLVVGGCAAEVRQAEAETAQAEADAEQARQRLASAAIGGRQCFGANAIGDPECPSPWGQLDPALGAAASLDQFRAKRIDECFGGSGPEDLEMICHYGQTGASRTVLVWGDSHAGALGGAFDVAGQIDGFQVVLAARAACPAATAPPPGVVPDIVI